MLTPDTLDKLDALARIFMHVGFGALPLACALVILKGRKE